MQTERADETGALGVLVGARADGDPAAAAALAVLADRLGYREIMIGEATGHDAFALAASLGAGPARLCIGPLPAAVRDPVTTARGVASVADLTGRATGVVLAASTSTVVEDWHGRSRADGVTVVAESAQALRGLLAGEKVDFSGALVRTHGYESALAPPLAQLSVLAFGPELTEVAAVRADRLVLPIGTVEHVSRLRARVQAAAERAGPPRPAPDSPVAAGRDRAGSRGHPRDGARPGAVPALGRVQRHVQRGRVRRGGPAGALGGARALGGGGRPGRTARRGGRGGRRRGGAGGAGGVPRGRAWTT